MKKYIEIAERYPDCYISAFDDGTEVEITDDTYTRWVRVLEEYDNIQKEMLSAWRHKHESVD